jgi:hypothetical protein
LRRLVELLCIDKAFNVRFFDKTGTQGSHDIKIHLRSHQCRCRANAIVVVVDWFREKHFAQTRDRSKQRRQISTIQIVCRNTLTEMTLKVHIVILFIDSYVVQARRGHNFRTSPGSVHGGTRGVCQTIRRFCRSGPLTHTFRAGLRKAVAIHVESGTRVRLFGGQVFILNARLDTRCHQLLERQCRDLNNNFAFGRLHHRVKLVPDIGTETPRQLGLPFVLKSRVVGSVRGMDMRVPIIENLAVKTPARTGGRFALHVRHAVVESSHRIRRLDTVVPQVRARNDGVAHADPHPIRRRPEFRIFPSF